MFYIKIILGTLRLAKEVSTCVDRLTQTHKDLCFGTYGILVCPFAFFYCCM